MAAKRLATEVGMKALHDGAEAILTESLSEVPHATGTLASRQVVTDASREDAVYISANTPYAVRQHEDRSLRHPDPRNPISTPGREAKYLEDPFNRLKAKVMEVVRLKAKMALKAKWGGGRAVLLDRDSDIPGGKNGHRWELTRSWVYVCLVRSPRPAPSESAS